MPCWRVPDLASAVGQEPGGRDIEGRGTGRVVSARLSDERMAFDLRCARSYGGMGLPCSQRHLVSSERHQINFN